MKKSISLIIIALMIIAIIFIACPRPTEDSGDSGDDTIEYTLSTSVVGNGSITLDPAGGTYNDGTVVTVEALPDTGWAFDSWTGDLTGNTNPTTITMDTNKNITANFVNNILYTDMVSVPSGTFTQEDTAGNTFTHSLSAFEIGKYEVTYELWYTVRTWGESNGYSFSNLGQEGHDGTAGASPTSDSKYEPVTYINWRDSMVWCNAYSEMTGRTPVYENGSGAVIKDSRDSNDTECDNAVINATANGYRLPTEGQWQYAASYIDGTSWLPPNHASGDNSSYCYPDDVGTSTVYGDYAWYVGNSYNSTHEVGTKLANDLGIYDMSGNLYEWCWDWYAISYPSDPKTDYEGAASGSYRVRRGGCWGQIAGYLQVGYRIHNAPYQEDYFLGLRVSLLSD
jgi:formylglycine-generating enzyme required for sulfatase activity